LAIWIISYTTVDTHVGRIYLKLNVSNAPAAVNKAHRLNLFPRDANP
jgi:DNA-binding CsgD family transcriptional regulator